MLNFAIIDDNTVAVKRFSHMLESIFIKYDYDAQIGCQTNNLNEFLLYLDSNKVDVMLLDIELHSELSGLQIAEKIRRNNKNCYFIFTTAHLEYCILAYKYKTFDYLCKPITQERLEDTIVRLFDDLKDSNKRFIKLDNKKTIIDENEIKYIKRDGMKIIFHTDSRDYEVYSSFAKIKDKLPENFVRCHKSFIANINNITKIEPTHNTIYFNNSFCDIGPKYKNSFLETFNNYDLIK